MGVGQWKSDNGNEDAQNLKIVDPERKGEFVASNRLEPRIRIPYLESEFKRLRLGIAVNGRFQLKWR